MANETKGKDLRLTPGQIQKAVRNYMANELGVDRNYITGIIREQVSTRNIDGIVMTELQKYFHKGPDGFKADEVVMEHVTKKVDRVVEDALELGCRARIKSAVQAHTDLIVNAVNETANIIRHGDPCPDGFDWSVTLRENVILGAIQRKIGNKARLEYACISNDLEWTVDIKSRNRLASAFAPIVRDTFGLDEHDLTVTVTGVISVNHAATKKLMSVLFPELRYERAVPVTGAIRFYGNHIKTESEE